MLTMSMKSEIRGMRDATQVRLHKECKAKMRDAMVPSPEGSLLTAGQRMILTETIDFLESIFVKRFIAQNSN